MWKNLLILLILAASVSGVDIQYPSGYNFDNQYLINSQNISSTDTLIITRTFTNNESFTINSFYFSDNIPANFILQSQTMTLNGNSFSYDFDNSQTSEFAGNNCYYWIIDDPSGAVQNSINPGDAIILELKLTCNIAGNYIWPMHTSCFYGNPTSFFATDNEISIVVTSAFDTTPPADIFDLSGF